MWECRYAKEPLDFKLLWLRFRTKIWMIPVAMLIGALLVLMCHYISRVSANGGRYYETTSVFYIDFATQENGDQYEFINYYTWGELIHSDYFMDSLYDSLGGKYTKEQLIGYVSATIESDVRYLYVRVTTHSSEQSLEIAKALEPIVEGFADTRKEFNEISVSDRGDTFRDSTKLRIKNACILGAVLGLFVILFVTALISVLDTNIYIPATLERRYGIPSLGAECMSEFKINCEHFLGDAHKIGYISIDGDENVPSFGTGIETVSVSNLLEDSSAADIAKTCDVIIIGVKAGRKNDKMLERYLDELSRLGISVTALLLNDADDKLIMAYYKNA